MVNDASKVAFAQSFVGLSETKQASVVGLRYAAAFNTKYVAAKGGLSSQMSLSFKLERGMNGGFTLWSLSGDDRDDTNHPASLKISYVARGEKAFVNQERAALATRVEALILQKASRLTSGLFGKSELKINLCAADSRVEGQMSGCPASVREFTATIVPLNAKVLDAWQKDSNTGCAAVGLVQQISTDSQCLSLAGHAAREKYASVDSSTRQVDVSALVTVISSPVDVVGGAPAPASALYDMCQKIASGGGGEVGGGMIGIPKL